MPLPSSTRIRAAALVALICTVFAPSAGAQIRNVPSLAVGSGPGHLTPSIPLTRYTLTGLPNGAAEAAGASDPADTKASSSAVPGLHFVTSASGGPAIAAIQTAAASHSSIPAIVLDAVAVGGHTGHVVLADCSVVSWTESGSGHDGKIQCARVVSESPTAQPTGPVRYDLKTNPSGR